MTDSPTRWMRWSEPGWRSTTLAIVLAAVAGGLFAASHAAAAKAARAEPAQELGDALNAR